MRRPISRRCLMTVPLLAAPAIFSGRVMAQAAGEPSSAKLAAIEAGVGGRLGVMVLDRAGDPRLAYRSEERFPICSTYKLLAAACVLVRVDRGEDDLGRRIRYGADALVTYSPATKPHAGADGMSLGDLCAAAVTLSDNTAGNLLLDSLGGPVGFTAMLRAQGDGTTRLDRIEPALNEALPGDVRDSSTPLATAQTLWKFLLGEALAPQSRARLAGWMVDCRTGDKRLRAGIPAGWRVGDKTGSGERATTNDVAILWPPEGDAQRGPSIVVAFSTGSPAPDAAREAALAAVGQLAARL